MTEELRAELLRRAEQDQAARREPEADWEPVSSVDAGNLAWLKNVVAEAGPRPWQQTPAEPGADNLAWVLLPQMIIAPVG